MVYFSIYYLQLALANYFKDVRLATANYRKDNDMSLKDAVTQTEYIINKIITDDEEIRDFLFTLGCYSGEAITVISHSKNGCIVSIKDGRYSIDNQLAEAIII